MEFSVRTNGGGGGREEGGGWVGHKCGNDSGSVEAREGGRGGGIAVARVRKLLGFEEKGTFFSHLPRCLQNL